MLVDCFNKNVDIIYFAIGSSLIIDFYDQTKTLCISMKFINQTEYNFTVKNINFGSEVYKTIFVQTYYLPCGLFLIHCIYMQTYV